MRGKWSRDESWRKFGMRTVSQVCMVVGTMEIGESVGRQLDGVSVVFFCPLLMCLYRKFVRRAFLDGIVY